MTRRCLRAAGVARAVAAVAVGVLLAGCVRMPSEGPVVVQPEAAIANSGAGAFYEPRPPVPGAGPRQVVLGFLEAMRATPIKTAVAAEFLSTRARGAWNPEVATVTYRDFTAPVGDRSVQVELVGAQRYDGRGAWVEALGEEQSRVELAMVLEDGEWRIDSVPDGLVVPASWFKEWFDRARLYFLGPGGDVLVPEPVYVPSGDQFAASLVRGLLAGPGEDLEGVLTSAIPEGLALALNSVPIDAQGVADVVLEGSPDDVGDDDVLDEAVVAQLAWTLRQEPRIRRIRVVVNGRELRIRSGGREVAVDTGRAFSPLGANATTDVFALREGRLVSGSVGSLEATTGPFGTRAEGLRTVSVDPRGRWAVGVSTDGSRLLRAPVTGSGAVTVLVDGAENLGRPAHDEAGRVWTVDRRADGARVLLADEQLAQEVTVPGVTGQDVRKVLVARDGTRLVAVVRGGSRDRLVVSRLEHTRGGVRARRAVEIGVPGGGRLRFTDVSWWSSDTLAVLSDVNDGLAQMQVVAVEGAPDDRLGAGAVSRIRGRATRLVTSPVDGTSPYVEVDGRLRHLLDPTQGIIDLPPDVTRVAHAG